MTNPRKIVEELLGLCGVTINGHAPWDIRVNDERFYTRVLRDKSLGLGESYMDGWWDCPKVDEFICRILRERLEAKVKGNWKLVLPVAKALLSNRQSKTRAKDVADRHYNIGNDLFLSFLDPNNQYSCAYFLDSSGVSGHQDKTNYLESRWGRFGRGDGLPLHPHRAQSRLKPGEQELDGNDLDRAQRNKMELICKKLNVQPEDHVLDIGFGWGGLAKYMAESYRCEVTGVNIAEEQVRFAGELCRDLPVEIIQADYRDVRGTFDKIVSVGMFEHVGRKNYRTFMEVAHRSLKDGGIFLLHTIGSNESQIESDPWISKYIFPNGELPSIAQITKSVEGLFVVEDLHNLGSHYDRTLMAWNDRFQRAWPRLKDKYNQRFKRMWEYYLLSCAGAFRARDIQLWQFVFTKPGTPQPEFLQ